MKSAVTISLVPEARGGPFVFWDDLPAATGAARDLGFDGLEVFPASAGKIANLRFQMPVAAVGTGAGWVKHQLTLTSPDADVRRRAIAFVEAIVDAAGGLGAPAIIGSMQGRASDLRLLRDALETLGERAKQYRVPLIYEPLNRYETNLVNRIEDGVALLESLSTKNVRLLADLFHMNIEEESIADAIRAGGKHIGHVHLADSNRRPAGFGHTDFAPIAQALRDIGYDGNVSAEAFPYPDSLAAANATIDAFNRSFR